MRKRYAVALAVCALVAAIWYSVAGNAAGPAAPAVTERVARETPEARVQREIGERAAYHTALFSFSDRRYFYDPTAESCWLQGESRVLEQAEAARYKLSSGWHFCIARTCGKGLHRRPHQSCGANVLVFNAAIESGLFRPVPDDVVAKTIVGAQ